MILMEVCELAEFLLAVWPLYDTESSIQFRYEIDRSSFRSMMLYMAWWARKLLGVYIVSQFSHIKALHSVDREYGTFSSHGRTTHIMIWVKGIPLSRGQHLPRQYVPVFPASLTTIRTTRSSWHSPRRCCALRWCW